METKFIIQRFDPEKNEKPLFKEYKLDTSQLYTILDVLIYIRENKDRGLAFRHSCRASICGSCAVRVNGRAVLACKTQIEDKVVKIEPLKGLEVIKDLVCDLTPFFDQIKKVHPWLEPKTEVSSENKERKMSPSDVQEIYKPVSCIFCACCQTDCPVSNNTDDYLGYANKIVKQHGQKISCQSRKRWAGLLKIAFWQGSKRFARRRTNAYGDEKIVQLTQPKPIFSSPYLGPAAATKAYRFVKDSRDGAAKVRLKDLEKLGIWYCAHAQNCVSCCPKEIEPIELIAELREASIKEGIKRNDGARHVLAFFKSIKKIGELDEARLPLRTFGVFRVIKFLPMAIRLMLKGKLPPIFPEKIKKLEQVKKIYKNVN